MRKVMIFGRAKKGCAALIIVKLSMVKNKHPLEIVSL